MTYKHIAALFLVQSLSTLFQSCHGFLTVSPVAVPRVKSSTTRPRRRRQVPLTRHSAAGTPPPPSQQQKDKSTVISNKKARESGIYSRPSTAIERGSGFFVPGLEGPKIRIVMGVLLLIGIGTNHILSSSSSAASNTMTVIAFTEVMAVLYSLLILLQAAIEFIKQQRKTRRLLEGGEEESSIQSSSSLFTQAWITTSRTGVPDPDSIEWTAQTYLSMTPATIMLLLSSEGILYWCTKQQQPPPPRQVVDDDIHTNDKIREACRAAVETVCASSSGRVALPNTHPAAALLWESTSLLPAPPKCIVLQRIPSTNRVWMMASSTDLLAAFTKQDLTWLGQLAKFSVKNE